MLITLFSVSMELFILLQHRTYYILWIKLDIYLSFPIKLSITRGQGPSLPDFPIFRTYKYHNI